jgi:hypothetical protein
MASPASFPQQTLVMMGRGFLFIMLIGSQAALAQLPAPGGGTCDLGTLDARVKQVDSVCCLVEGKPGSRCGRKKGYEWYHCSVDCAVRLLPLLKECGPVLDKLYDHLDKRVDGHAEAFTQAHHSCLAIPASTVLENLTQLHKKNPGVCTESILNNVGTAKVVRVCKDQNPRCAAGIKSGFVTCPAKGLCDKTCNLCGGMWDLRDKGEGHRRIQKVLNEKKSHRRTQTHSCNLQSFDSDMRGLNTKCCDDGGKCRMGIPNTCDAKCAVAYVQFFNRCHNIMTDRYSTKQMEAFTQLHDTCATKLSTVALLEAVAKCHGDSSEWNSGASSSAAPCPSRGKIDAASGKLLHRCDVLLTQLIVTLTPTFASPFRKPSSVISVITCDPL